MFRNSRYVASALALICTATLFAAPPASAPTRTPDAASRPAGSPLTGIVEDPTKPSPSGGLARPSAGFLNTHNRLLAKAKAGGIELYMEGDSITDFWQTRFAANWNANLAPWKAGDFGISGDRTQNVLYRIENGELDGVNPKVVVLMIGTNNLASNATYGENTVEDTVKGVVACVDAIHKKAPDAKVLVMSILPRFDPPPKARPDINARIVQTNEAIAKLDNGKTVRYLSIYDKFIDKDGKMIPGLLNNDNLHPADKGYQVWFDAMKPILTEWLGAPPAPAKAAAPGTAN